MTTASEIQRQVLEALASADPGAAAIDVSVCDGVVTLTGQVESFAARRTAEKAVSLVPGVRGLVNDVMIVRMPSYGGERGSRYRLPALKARTPSR